MSARRKLRLDLPLILPDVDDIEDRCVERLVDRLAGRPGITEAHIVPSGGVSAELCIHYDPSAISLSRVRELVQSVGADLSDRFSHLLIWADGPLDAHAARRIAEQLRNVPGVLEADVGGSGALRIEYDRQQVSRAALLEQAAEYGIRPSALTLELRAPGKEAETALRASGGNEQVRDALPSLSLIHI